MSSILIKTELRVRVREEIDSLPNEYVRQSNKGIFLQVTSLKAFSDARNIMLYYSVEREPDTVEIAKHALANGKTVAFPYCFRGGIMQAREVKDLNILVPAILGIPAPPDEAPLVEPEKLDLIIVPALAFDKSGYRLGYGGGYYDRYLSDISAYTVGITRHRLLRDEVPREKHDVAVNCLVTEEIVLAQP
ncbi:MAG: 5-formyltetrahydrofolate cyclo-ligase [Oscillospiraceae bacterium]|nr:5-formyltetrahydrofolate cyclo-ligase [Oscillospiraceae bacterium]MCL2227706.1 5-formyltetrahydrofolate cyclo-ligase [Oscillospiraceae bacterium]